MARVDADILAPTGCPVATRVDALGSIDDVWMYETNTCVAAKGSVRCGRLTDGFARDLTALDARAAFQWDGLPCAVTRDSKLRCYREDKTKEAATLAPAQQIALYERDLCTLSRTAVSCRIQGNVVVLASNVQQFSGGAWVWALRNDGKVVRLGTCLDGSAVKSCSFDLTGVHDAIAISSAGIRACVLSRDGSVACNECDPKAHCTNQMQAVDGISDATQIAVGYSHACVLRKNGEVVCWGNSQCGQAGGTIEAGKVCSDKPIVLPPTTIMWAR